MGWDYQLKDELVFQFSRARLWRSWASESDHVDFLWGTDLKLGTIESSTNIGMMLRVGQDMQHTYSSALLNDDRTTNPVNIYDGWYFYIGASTSYLFNMIYLDGNTYKDGPSVDYDRFQVDGFFGFAYAWKDVSISIAVNNIDLHSGNNSIAELKKYGSLTFLWRL